MTHTLTYHLATHTHTTLKNQAHDECSLNRNAILLFSSHKIKIEFSKMANDVFFRLLAVLMYMHTERDASICTSCQRHIPNNSSIFEMQWHCWLVRLLLACYIYIFFMYLFRQPPMLIVSLFHSHTVFLFFLLNLTRIRVVELFFFCCISRVQHRCRCV